MITWCALFNIPLIELYFHVEGVYLSVYNDAVGAHVYASIVWWFPPLAGVLLLTILVLQLCVLLLEH